jgi:putative ATP-dependent endonuclease of the OLD family
MRVVALHIAGFRGWMGLMLKPAGHMLVVGEPRAGRSDLIDALRRVLDPDFTRNPPDEFDALQPGPAAPGSQDAPFPGPSPVDGTATSTAGGDEEEATRSALVEVTLGDLGDVLEQHFYRRLELWDRASSELVTESVPGEIDSERHALVLRLCYRLQWNPGEGTGEHWVEYPKTSRPDDGIYDRARRADRLLLPFAAITPGRPLSLRSDGKFRMLLSDGGGDLGKTLDALLVAVDTATDGLSGTDGIRQTLAEILEAVRPTLAIAPGDLAEKLVQFRAEDGTVAGLLRALQPVLQMDQGGPHLPLRRHGSTAGAVLDAAEAMITARRADAIVVADDFGDRLDTGAAEYLAGRLRGSCAQLWLSTRRPEAARAFQVTEVIRLTRHGGQRQVHQVQSPSDRSDLVALRQLHVQLLPAMSARTVVVFEGPHDVAALTAVSDRFAHQADFPVPAAHGVRLVAASFADGGHGMVPKVCRLARQLGFRVIAALDFDKAGWGADESFTTAQDVADEVVRLPLGFAIERALLHGIPGDALRAAMAALNAAWQLNFRELDFLDDDKLRSASKKALKQKSGLHAEYVALLPLASPPPVAVDLLTAITDLATGARKGPLTLEA